MNSPEFIAEKVATDARTVEARAEISAEWEREAAVASAKLHDQTPQAGDQRPRIATDYAALSTQENDFLAHMSRWGSDGYPVLQLSSSTLRNYCRTREFPGDHTRRVRGWIWGDFCGVKGAPVVYKSKRACVAAIEAYLSILADRAAGRVS